MQATVTAQQPDGRVSESRRRLSIAIPVYNEGENIRGAVEKIEAKVAAPYSIHVVYDFPEDSTLPAVARLNAEGRQIVTLKNQHGRGALGAIRTALETLDGPILITMADLSDDMSCVKQMLEKLDEGYDLVCGSRYMKGGRQLGGPLLKRTLSRLAGVSLHYLSGIPTHDVTNSFKLYTRRVLDDITVESTGGFEVGLEIVAKAYLAGYRIGEVPTTWRDRSAGGSRFRLWKWLPKYLRWYLHCLRGIAARRMRNSWKR